jgi:aminotransferase
MASSPARPSRHARRIGGFQESVIREMTRVAARCGAINLSQGLPDMPAPEALKEAACHAVREEHNQYSFTYGDPQVRAALARKLADRNGILVDPEDEVPLTCGVSEGVMAACLGLLNPGDEVVLFEPYYENYLPGIRMAGAEPRWVTLRFPDWRFDPDELAAAFTPRTRALILNNPMNPAGKVFAEPELRRIADLCAERDCVIITDEIYEDILYDGRCHISIGSLDAAADRTVTVMGIGKTYGVTGWRVGYVAARGDLSAAVRKVHDYLTICAPTPFQRAALAALAMPPSFYVEVREGYRRRRDLLCDGLADVGFGLARPEGAYYVLADFTRLRREDDRAFARWLAADGGVATVPGSSFYAVSDQGRRLVRFCFAMRESTLAEALRRIRARCEATRRTQP